MEFLGSKPLNFQTMHRRFLNGNVSETAEFLNTMLGKKVVKIMNFLGQPPLCGKTNPIFRA